VKLSKEKILIVFALSYFGLYATALAIASFFKLKGLHGALMIGCLISLTGWLVQQFESKNSRPFSAPEKRDVVFGFLIIASVIDLLPLMVASSITKYSSNGGATFLSAIFTMIGNLLFISLGFSFSKSKERKNTGENLPKDG
jgi:hypothetical protein